MQVKDEADTTFISEVFSGCVHYQGLIKVLHVCVCVCFWANSAHVGLPAVTVQLYVVSGWSDT